MRATVCVTMGVSGSGKTEIGALIASRMGWAFQDADDLHPQSNIDKMAAGRPLTDEDRAPWLARVASVIDGWQAQGRSGVLACSALRRAYRDAILGGREGTALLYLKGSYETILTRMTARHGHFMPPALLRSQFDTLEEPGPDEHPIVVSDEGALHETADAAVAALLEREKAG